MKVQVLLTFLVLSGCSSSDDKARALLADARLLEDEAKSQIWDNKPGTEILKPQVEACVEKASAAKKKMEELSGSYGSAPVANETETMRLKRNIESVLRECNRLNKMYAGS